MHDGQRVLKYNLRLFFVDGATFMPSLALISITAVIPFFLEQLDATTFQIALAVTLPMICMLLTQPLFGFIASRSLFMSKTFGKILLLQRAIFLLYILTIPLFSGHNTVLVNTFLISWAVFNVFVGSYAVFHTPIVLKLLPPNKRGFIRSIGFAVGSFIGVGMSALIPVMLLNFLFPYNFMAVFLLGFFFLLANAIVFLLMRQAEDIAPNEPMSLKQYTLEMPKTLRKNPAFRAMLVAGLALAVANSVLPYYTLYAIREFYATEAHIALLTGLAIFSTAIGNMGFGFLVDRYGPRFTMALVACFTAMAGIVALTTNTLGFLLVAWVLANIGNSGFMMSLSLLFGIVSPSNKLPLYVGVHTTISSAFSAVVILALSPILDNIGFIPLFALVLACGLLSLFVNLFLLRKRIDEHDIRMH